MREGWGKQRWPGEALRPRPSAPIQSRVRPIPGVGVDRSASMSDPRTNKMAHRWLCGVCVALLAVFIAVGAWPGSLRAQPATTHDNVFRSVKLVVEYGEGFEKRYTALAWKKGMSVADAMGAARSMPAPRGLAFESVGAGERAFLKSIDGVANEGGAQGARNWLYWINDEFADESFGAGELKPGDTATWRFIAHDWKKDKKEEPR